MHGQTVCRMHGGSAPQARRKAEERLRDLVDPAISVLAALIEQADSDWARFAACKYVLDWAGFRPKDRIEAHGAVDIKVVWVDEEQPIGYLARATERTNGYATHPTR